MYHFSGRIRDYSSSSDTASVEFDGLGTIDAWANNLKIDPSVNRAYLVHGNPVTLAAPDEHKIGDAIVVGFSDVVTLPVQTGSAGAITTQTGHGLIGTNASGAGSAAITFSPAYVTTPTISAAVDDHPTTTLTGVSAAGFTINVTGAPDNAVISFSWHATGH